MKVVIVGYGWLGQQLASKLVSLGHQLYVTCRTPETLACLAEQQDGMVLDLNYPAYSNPRLLEMLENATVICAVPPGRQQSNQYAIALANLAQLMVLAKSTAMVHLSSTGIYQGLSGDIAEDSVLELTLPKVRLLADGELALQRLPICITLRLAGLIGQGRHPGRFVAGKVLPDPHSTVNMLHAKDAISAIAVILSGQAMTSGVFNLCSPDIVTRQHFYQSATKQLNTQVVFNAQSKSSESRRIIADKFVRHYNFDFHFKSAIDALTHCS